jgi:hypothetical protein
MNIKRSICIFVNKLRKKLNNEAIYKINLSDEFPDEFEGDIIYIRGEKKYLWSFAMECPCGCRDIIYANLITDEHPFWKITWNLNGTISISPSIWRNKGCRSHFFIKNCKIDWCKY